MAIFFKYLQHTLAGCTTAITTTEVTDQTTGRYLLEIDHSNYQLSERSNFAVDHFYKIATQREFGKQILYKNIRIIAIQHSKIDFEGTFGDFSCSVK